MGVRKNGNWGLRQLCEDVGEDRYWEDEVKGGSVCVAELEPGFEVGVGRDSCLLPPLVMGIHSS